MSIDRNYIRNLAPEFVSESDARIDFVISISDSGLNVPFWPASKIDLARALFVCHLLKIGNLKGAVSLGGKKVGDLQQTYHQSTLKNPLAATGYGLMLMQLIDTLLITPIGTGEAASPFAWGNPYVTTLNWPD